MTVLEIRCLEALRDIGPCSNADIARNLGVAMDVTYRAVNSLVEKGLAAHPKKQEWNATRLGLTRLGQVGDAKPKLAETRS